MPAPPTFSVVTTSSAASWMLSLYPQAGEGGGCFVSSKEPDRSYVRPRQRLDPERAAEEAAPRVRAKLRRYCAANRFNRLGTQTYGHPRCSDPGLVRTYVGLFFRQMRDKLGDDPLPYAWVPEVHKDGVHFHVHFAVGRYVPRGLIESAWDRGHVHIKLLGDLPIGSGTLGVARLAARYLSKTVTKSFIDPATRATGMHLYDLAQGFQPEVTRLYGRSPGEVIGQASAMLGAQPAVRWNSDEVDPWVGPPAIWAQWDT